MKTKNFISPFISCVVQNFPFIEESFDGLTQYQLLCKIVEKLNEVITQTNIQSENITKLEDAFNTLKNYVDNYFNNLDVQTEINKKLDEMALSGELEEIIASYLNTQAVRGFSTLNDLKNATGLITGAICQTSGKNTYNDGFGSLYRIRNITNEDTIDNDKLVAITTDISLVAEKITNNISNSKTTGTDNTYSCDYINNQVDVINNNINNKPNAINAYTTSTKNTYACDYINGIIESGSNTNGNWIKFVDGTMITYKEIEVEMACNTAWGNLFVGNYATAINFPQTFKELPKVLIDLKLKDGACFKVEWEVPIITTSSYKNVGIGRATTSNSVGITITLYAIGKWK